MLLDRILDPAILGTLIPIVAILAAVAITLTHRLIRHRERMAMIERGMHPDAPPLAEDLEADEDDRVELELTERSRSPRGD